MASDRRGATPSVRTGLSHERIVTAALAVIAVDGTDGLTMSALAKHLGVGTMTLYWYFPKKDDLFAAVASRVHQSLAAEDDEADSLEWDASLFSYFTNLRRRLLQTPSLAPLLVSYGRLATSQDNARPILERLEAQLESMVASGIPLRDAMCGLETLSQYALGFTMREAGRDRTQRHGQLWQEALSEAGGADTFALVGATLDVLEEPGGDELFENGLHLILAGLRSQIER
jgi:AcrR family transcriptional regulator